MIKMNTDQCKLAVDNMNMVPWVVWHRFRCLIDAGAEPEELIGIGNVALCEAALCYKEGKAKFGTYAVRMITSRIYLWARKSKRLSDAIGTVISIYATDEQGKTPLDKTCAWQDNYFEGEAVRKAFERLEATNPRGLEQWRMQMRGYRSYDIAARFGITPEGVRQNIMVTKRRAKGIIEDEQ